MDHGSDWSPKSMGQMYWWTYLLDGSMGHGSWVTNTMGHLMGHGSPILTHGPLCLRLIVLSNLIQLIYFAVDTDCKFVFFGCVIVTQLCWRHHNMVRWVEFTHTTFHPLEVPPKYNGSKETTYVPLWRHNVSDKRSYTKMHLKALLGYSTMQV